jgi:condensin complex subunit 3
MDLTWVQFLRSFDLLKSKVAEDALLSVFVTRADVFDNVEFKGRLDHFTTSLQCILTYCMAR